MNSLLTVARFEWHYHRRRPVTYLFAGLIFAHGCWSVMEAVERYPGNSPSTLAYFSLSSLGVVLAIVSVLLAGQSLAKDHEFKAANYLYALPVTNRMYLAGRFLGTFATALTLAIFQPIGSLAAFLYIDPVAPLPGLAVTDGFVWLTVENVFIVVSLAFSITVLLRSIRGAYISLFLVILYFLLTETQTDSGSSDDIWHLLDPFGVGMVRASIEAMSQAEAPDALLTFSDMLLINRLLWLGLALGLLAQAEAAFSLQSFGRSAPLKRRPAALDSGRELAPNVARLIHPLFGGRVRLRLFIRLVRLDFLTLVRQPIVWVTMGLLVLLTILLATALGQNSNFPELPITSAMTALRLPMGVFISLFLLVMTGETLFQERTIGFWPIADALPQPAFIRLLAKLLALMVVAFLLTAVLFLTGIGLQISQNFGDIDWSLYAQDLIVDGFLRYCQLIILGAFVAAVVNDRIISHVVSLLVFGLLWLPSQFGSSETTGLLYSFLPGSGQYSNLIGYGVNEPFRLPVHILWWTIAGMLATGTVLFWNRGLSVGFMARIRAGQQQFGWGYGLALLLFTMGFGLSVSRIQGALDNQTAHRILPAKPEYESQISVVSITGKSIPVGVVCHDNYQTGHILNAARFAIQQGEKLFGPFPQTGLQIIEIPTGPNPVRSEPGRVFIAETEGWTANYHYPAELDHIDYLIAREIFKQWLTHRMHPIRQPGDGFLRQSLPEYLALWVVGKQYGPERLKQRLSQRSVWYMANRNRTGKREVTLLQTTGNDALERGRAALMLSSIGQVWGDTTLRRSIGQFYRLALQRPESATATAFANHLNRQLPDSLRYLTNYLTDRLWFSFKVGRVANLPNGLSVEIFPKKWHDDATGQPQPLLINDLIPLTVFDRDGQVIYQGLVRPEPDERWVHLPIIAEGGSVVIDPMGTWPELAKYDNRKIF